MVKHIIWVGLLAGCAGQNTSDLEDESNIHHEELGVLSHEDSLLLGNKLEPSGTIYTNGHGTIQLIEINDTLMQTIFRNTNGDTFDTTMQVLSDFTITSDVKGLPFLSLGLRGIQMHEDSLQLYEFSNLLFIDQFIQIDSMYEKPFLKERH